MMAGDAGAAVLETKDAEPKIPDKEKTNFDVVIIGAGPAGYTAGIYCSRAGYDTVILSGLLPGGQLVNTTEVENYPGFENGIMGPDLMIDMRKQSQRMGVTIVDDVVVDVDFRRKPFKVLTASEEYEGRAIIIATGANPKKLGIKGEEKFAGKGVSYCATCDGPFFRDQEIIVVGGGDSAIEEATFLTKFATNVHIVHRRGELRASKIMQDRALHNEKIKFHWNCAISEITGDQKVRQAVIKNLKTDEETPLDAGGLFVAIGHEPNTELFKGQINLDDDGYIILEKKTHTNIEGIFAAGDVHDKSYRQAVTAAGFGCMAAIDVDKYLTENPSGQ